MLAAVMAEGTTQINNVAMEPEVVDLADFLAAMGANIKGQGTETIVVEGVDSLRGVEYEVIPDRIVAGTLAIAGAATRGDVTVARSNPRHLDALLATLRECGAEVTTGDDWFACRAARSRGAPAS